MPLKPVVYAILSASIGVALFRWAALPLPWLLGPIFACLLAAFLRLPMREVKPISNAMRAIIGVALGASLTPAIINVIPNYWQTLLLIPLSLLLIGYCGIVYFHRLCGYDFATSYYATMPGGLQDMILFASQVGGNPRSLALIHATRVLLIVFSVPILLKLFWPVDLINPPSVNSAQIPTVQLLLLITSALGGWWLAHAFGLFGSSLLGPILLASILSLLGILQFRPPNEAIWLAQFFIGMGIGVKYAGISVTEVRRDIVAALGYCLVLALLTLLIILPIMYFSIAPSMETLLSMVPGAQAEMLLVSLVVGADITFVIAHHLLRMLLVILASPLCYTALKKRLQMRSKQA